MKEYLDLYNEYFIDKKYGSLLSADNNINLSVFIDVSHSCNYNCSYCINTKYNNNIVLAKMNKLKTQKNYSKLAKAFNINLHTPTSDYQPDTKNTCIFLNKFISANKFIDLNDEIEIIFTGLECTLNKRLLNIMEYFYNNIYYDFKLKLQTNGSQSIDYYKNILNRYNDRLKMDITFHPEFADINHFVKLINMLNENNCKYYNIKIMLFDEYKNKIFMFFDAIKTIAKRIRLLPIKNYNIDIMNNYNYIMQYIKKNKLDTDNRMLYNFDSKTLYCNFTEMNYFSQHDRVLKNMLCYLPYERLDIINNNIHTNCVCINDIDYSLNDVNNYIKWVNEYKPIECCKGKCFCPPKLKRDI